MRLILVFTLWIAFAFEKSYGLFVLKVIEENGNTQDLQCNQPFTATGDNIKIEATRPDSISAQDKCFCLLKPKDGSTNWPQDSSVNIYNSRNGSVWVNLVSGVIMTSQYDAAMFRMDVVGGDPQIHVQAVTVKSEVMNTTGIYIFESVNIEMSLTCDPISFANANNFQPSDMSTRDPTAPTTTTSTSTTSKTTTDLHTGTRDMDETTSAAFSPTQTDDSLSIIGDDENDADFYRMLFIIIGIVALFVIILLMIIVCVLICCQGNGKSKTYKENNNIPASNGEHTNQNGGNISRNSGTAENGDKSTRNSGLVENEIYSTVDEGQESKRDSSLVNVTVNAEDLYARSSKQSE